MNTERSNLIKNMQIQLKKRDTFQLGINTLIDLRNQIIHEIDTWLSILKEEDYHVMPYVNAKGYHSKNIAYSLWHIFRIEDIVCHSLIKKDEQIFFLNQYQARMNASIITTGNELKGYNIEQFTKQLNIKELYHYIHEVKESSDTILKQLNFDDLRQTFSALDRLRLESLNVVSTDDNAIWLLDYWCGKDTRGLIQMPFSRHWFMHFEACLRIIDKINKRKK